VLGLEPHFLLGPIVVPCKIQQGKGWSGIFFSNDVLNWAVHRSALNIVCIL